MALETAAYINGLVASNPPAADPVTQADDHLRLIKAVLKNTFPNLLGPVTATQLQLSAVPQAGFVSYWWGALVDLPAGYGLCDGSTYDKLDGSGTIVSPNLINRFILGAGGSVTLGAYGGTLGPTITTAAAGGHTPAGTNAPAGGHDHGGATQGHALTAGENGQHDHFSFNTDDTGGSLGGVAVDASTYPMVGAYRTSSTFDQYRINGTATVASIGKTSQSGSGTAHTHPITAAADHTHVFTGTPVADHQHTLPLPAYMALWPVIHL